MDWALGIKLAGNSRKTAEELLDLLAKNLPNDLIKMEALWREKNYPALLAEVHKLHGALCYCGAPELKAVTISLEKALKQNQMSELTPLMSQFKIAVKNILTYLGAR